MVDLTECDREPIHIPGTTQSYGVLLVLTEPALTVAQISDNVGSFFPLGVRDILDREADLILEAKKREYGKDGNNGTDGKRVRIALTDFRLFRYFRLFRILFLLN